MELIGRDKTGQAAVGEVWTRGPPPSPLHNGKTRRYNGSDIAPGRGGDEAMGMGQTEWGQATEDGLDDQRRRRQDQFHVHAQKKNYWLLGFCVRATRYALLVLEPAASSLELGFGPPGRAALLRRSAKRNQKRAVAACRLPVISHHMSNAENRKWPVASGHACP
jgi:hypothetical protein